jgi:transcriptional regulatory protein RtcR
LAKRIFELKRLRKQVTGNFFEVNCAILRGDSAMSTLFGHVKGAFTGAVDNRKGLLASSNQGVLFLDEIGELRLDEQAMLLRAIEEKKFTPVGSDKEVSSDFQLLAGTNRDLREDVKEGRFREDLLARINLWTFRLPGLKDRREDIAPNLRYELEQFAVRTGRKLNMNHEATQRYLDFANQPESTWSANFRDLNASVTRMATLCHDGRITLADVDSEIERLRFAWGRDSSKTENPNSLTEGLLEKCLTQTQIQNLDHFDSIQLAEVIRICRQSKSLSDAGRKLFSASRQSKAKPNDADRLRKYLARFDLTWENTHASR